MTTHFSPKAAFELLELPDGRCYVARSAEAAAPLVAGSFARLEPLPDEAANDPVGVYASRDEAEIAILRASPTVERADPLAIFASLFDDSR